MILLLQNQDQKQASAKLTSLGAETAQKRLIFQPGCAYRDCWNLFDQILLSRNWGLTRSYLNHYKPIIYKNSDMIETQGKYAGYPKRTWNGNQFRGGFSDHFPVALIFKPNNAENPLK